MVAAPPGVGGLFTLGDLLSCLELETTSSGFRCANLPIDYHRVFGGQILAQLVAVAAAVAPEKSVKSLTALFPREGDTAQPMDYAVEVVQNGRTFATVKITASQDARVVCVALASLHAAEPGLDRNDPPPAGPGPDECEPMPLLMIPWDVRVVGSVDLDDRRAGPAELNWWMRAPTLADAPAVHQALLAHASDLTLIGTALRPFDGVSQGDTGTGLQTAVTSHTLTFHRPLRLDNWLLLAQKSPTVSGGRAFGRGDVFTGDGRLVASFAQESMIRSING